MSFISHAITYAINNKLISKYGVHYEPNPYIYPTLNSIEKDIADLAVNSLKLQSLESVIDFRLEDGTLSKEDVKLFTQDYLKGLDVNQDREYFDKEYRKVASTLQSL